MTKSDTQIRLCEATSEEKEVAYVIEQATKAVNVGDTAAILIPSAQKIIHFVNLALINPAKRKAMAVKNEKRFLKQKRNALKNPGYSHHPVKTQASFKRLLKAV